MFILANEQDMEAARESGMSESLLDRLLLTPQRIEGEVAGVRQVAALPIPWAR
jgi:glutamate-5-semialdehyde dehydrogenase